MAGHHGARGCVVEARDHGATARPGTEGQRLRSWKAIAAFFKVDVRTAKRWEATRGLPVHRLPGDQRGAVYADAAELADWLRAAGRVEPAPGEQPPIELPPVEPDVSPPASVSRRRPGTGLIAAALLAAAIVGAVAWQRPEAQAAGRAPDQAYLTGLYHLGTRTAPGLALAQRYFETAIARDPAGADAYAGLAEAHAMQAQFADVPADEANAQAEALAARALALDPAQPRALALTGYLAWSAHRDLTHARALFDRAIAADPDAAQAHLWYAMVLMHTGDQRRPLAEIARAQALDPGSRTILVNRALILFHAGQVTEAERVLRQLAEVDPKPRSPPEYLATLYAAGERWDDYLREATRAAAITGDPECGAIAAAAARGWRAGGRRGLLEARLSAERDAYARGRYPAFKLAQTEALLGRGAARWRGSTGRGSDASRIWPG